MTLEQLLTRLEESSGSLDQSGDWPREQFADLAAAGVLQWVIPREYGGTDISNVELTEGYEALAKACLTTTFILTQRNGACQRIAACENEELKAELLPSLARGETFATVGISHLTTSRQHVKTPAVQVQQEGNSLKLNGMIPWVTGADQADFVVTGGTDPQGRQMLIVLPTDSAGVEVQPFARLMALTESRTASIKLDGVTLPDRFLIAGPIENVMKQGAGGAGSLTTSTLALGLTARALELIAKQAEVRSDLKSVSEQFQQEFEVLRNDLYRSTADGDAGMPQLSAASIRQRANSLAIRATQAAMAVSKGAGFVHGHPAERAVREAMFFLVWSCPQPVVQGVLEELTCREGL